MRKKRKYYIYVTEEQIRQAALELERQENMDLDQEIAEANAWAEANHIVRRPFPEVPPKRRPMRQILKPRRDNTVQIAKKSRFKPYIQLAAVFIIVLFGGWYTQTDSVQGMRLDLVNLFTNEVRDKGTLELKGQSEWDGFYVPEYLPSGAMLVDSTTSETIFIQRYSINGQWLNISQFNDHATYIYKENEASKIYVQNKYEANLLIQNGVWYITWYDDRNFYILVEGNISIEEGLMFVNNLTWSNR